MIPRIRNAVTLGIHQTYKQTIFLIVALLSVIVVFIGTASGKTIPVLHSFIDSTPAGDVINEATSYGPVRSDIPVAPVLNDGKTVGYVFVTSDFVGTTGYSGKPIHVLVAIGLDGKLQSTKLVKHSEPIVLIGIPERKIRELTESYSGLDIVAKATADGFTPNLEIVSGATVTVMIIDDSIVRSSIKVARALGLGGLAQNVTNAGPQYVVDMEKTATTDWAALASDGSVRKLALDVGQINAAFEKSGDLRAAERPETGPSDATFIDMQTALVSVPAIGRSLLGDAEYKNLLAWLEEGEQAIVVMARGRYSFKGSGYVRGGIFGRIQLIQADNSFRFRDRQHRRLGEIVADGAPTFTEIDLFKIPADAGFDASGPWRIQLLVQRAVGPIEKSFLTFDLGYKLPNKYLLEIKQQPIVLSVLSDDDAEARTLLWKRIWEGKKVEIGILLIMLATLTGVFFFQKQVTRNEVAFFWFRMSFLFVTLVFLGWYANAQLSVVNLMALAASLKEGFTWDAFLMDPLVFILWISVATALLFWGRGAFCGWLCPFGALQELTNRIARFFHVPQWTLPWGLHERLWPLKYMIFLALFGLSLGSISMAEQFSEIEPFKTAIVLKFQREWPFIVFVAVLLGAGLFVERFYCRYLCPLGAALAIPGRMRMFDWLKRYKECGSPCQICAHECFVQAIHPTGEINPNECLSCLHCQLLYQDDQKCPVRIKVRKSREKLARSTAQSAEIPDRFSGQV